ncbi:MAG: hypothetical protein UW80_C0033G0007 [Microgenomates group bacterium GW2011_GWC1_44_9]|nr:MAG: hypothetical protein UW80_C0033G0007 [Microgenomates group bacterium GW2011_GWC1_44_9]
MKLNDLWMKFRFPVTQIGLGVLVLGVLKIILFLGLSNTLFILATIVLGNLGMLLSLRISYQQERPELWGLACFWLPVVLRILYIILF